MSVILALPVTQLRVGDMVDMQPVYEAYDETDTGDYLASQTELGLVETIDRCPGCGTIPFPIKKETAK